MHKRPATLLAPRRLIACREHASGHEQRPVLPCHLLGNLHLLIGPPSQSPLIGEYNILLSGEWGAPSPAPAPRGSRKQLHPTCTLLQQYDAVSSVPVEWRINSASGSAS